MTVRVVVDSSSCMDAGVAERLGITILPLHVIDGGEHRTTSGLSPLELTACYARQLERGGECGVLALHLSKELSSTWSSAVTAAGVFSPGSVRIVDTNTVGMGIAEAAVCAARAAHSGATLDECYEIAVSVLARSSIWLYFHSLDDVRRSGRLSSTRAFVSTALPMRPVWQIRDGRIEIAANARTQSRALEKLIHLVLSSAQGAEAGTKIFIAECAAYEVARSIARACTEAVPTIREPSILRMDPALSVHAGPGSVAVCVCLPEVLSTEGTR